MIYQRGGLFSLRTVSTTKWALLALIITSVLLMMHVYIGYEDSVKLSTAYKAVKDKIYIYPTKPANQTHLLTTKTLIDITSQIHNITNRGKYTVTRQPLNSFVLELRPTSIVSPKEKLSSNDDLKTYPTKPRRSRLPYVAISNKTVENDSQMSTKNRTPYNNQTIQSTYGSPVIRLQTARNGENIEKHDKTLVPILQSSFNQTSNYVDIKNISFSFSPTPYRGYWVEAEGLFVDRLEKYNAAITKLRKQILHQRGYKPWTDVNISSLQVIWGNTDDFLEKLSDRVEVKTVFLPWYQRDSYRSNAWNSLVDFSNVLTQKYYKWVATQPLCLWIETPGLTKARWDAVYNRTCSQEYKDSRAPVPLEVVYLNAKPINRNHYWPNDGNAYPERLYTSIPEYVFHIHIVEDAIVTPPGDIISGTLKLVPYTCAQDISPDLPSNVAISPIYKEVFIITQFWGNTFFHRMLEMMPRIIPFLQFLRENKEIFISIPGEDKSLRELFSILGISSERSVIGTVRAKVAYMPRGTPCAFPLVQETQLFSHEMRKYIKETMSPRKRNKLVMIRRTGLRQFRYNDLIEKTLSELADEYKLDFALFRDNPTPPLRETMLIFYEAVLIVAPHGAGLANMLFSQPGTYIIECVCNPPHVNMCFQRTAHILGHRYHGIPSREGCEGEIHVYPEVIDFVARRYLDYITSNKS